MMLLSPYSYSNKQYTNIMSSDGVFNGTFIPTIIIYFCTPIYIAAINISI